MAVPPEGLPPPTAERVPEGWIVSLQPGVDGSDADELARAHGGRAGHLYRHVLRGFSFRGSDAAAAALAADPRVRTVVADQIVRAVAETVPSGVRRIRAAHPGLPDAHDAGYAGASARIAILDTGIDLDHPDLAANVDAAAGRNCIDATRSPDDDHGHGTHVAGTAAALDNDIGVVGVAPRATLVPVKVLNSGAWGTWSQIICGVDHVTSLLTDGIPGNEVHVANMSLGGTGSAGTCTDGGLRQAICESVAAGVVYTVSAGNSSADASGFLPAAFPEVITVSALSDADGEPAGDTVASFSNHGSVVDVIAPGTGIYSTARGGGYATMNGTSMAAPHVAGVVALVRALNGSLGPAAGETLLKETGYCPNGQRNDEGPTCDGQGAWSGDRDATAEPLVGALWAAHRAADQAGINDLPAAADDAYSTPVGQTLSVSAPGVLSNDSDVEAEALSTELLSAPVSGALTFRADGSFEYVPEVGFAGSVTFSYRAVDGGLAADTATVTISVTPTMHVADLDASSAYGSGKWRATVTITVRDSAGGGVSNAAVSASWSGGYSGTATCTTGASGRCSLTSGTIRKQSGSVTLTVTNVSHAALAYDRTANSDPEADSNGTSIRVLKPS